VNKEEAFSFEKVGYRFLILLTFASVALVYAQPVGKVDQSQDDV